jgi:L-fuculose-phosphate aldolase
VNHPLIEQWRTEIVDYSHRLDANGWVANHDGNLSARLSDSHLLCTPTAISKGDLEAAWLIVVDGENTVVEGSRRSFSELQLHRAAYDARPDISVVMHAHPPTSCAFAVAGVPIPHPMMAEPVVSLGCEIPMVPYHRPGDPKLSDAIAEALQRADVILLERHGLLSVGGGFEQAYLRMELVEHLANIGFKARQLGHARILPQSEIDALSKKGRPVSHPVRVSAESSTQALNTGVTASPPQVSALVSDALKRFS